MNKKEEYSFDAIIRQQKKFYTKLLNTYDIYSQKSVAWFDCSQPIRFDDLTRIIPDKVIPYSLLDIGCGLGDYKNYLESKGFSNISYHGIDALKEMVYQASIKYPNASIINREFVNEGFNTRYDILVCCGAMNLMNFRSYSKNLRFVKRFIEKMYRLSKIGSAFNLMSREDKHHFTGDEAIFYADKEEILDYCRDLCRYSDLIENSNAFGFTVLMNKRELIDNFF